MLTVLPLYPSACPAQLPSPFCCFAACVDVYGTHSNVHLRCFHTGKSTAIHAAPSPWKLPVLSSSVIIIISLIWSLHFLDLVSLKVCRQTAAHSTPFYLYCQSMRSSLFWWYQCVHTHCHSNLFCLTDLFRLYSMTIFGAWDHMTGTEKFLNIVLPSHFNVEFLCYIHVSIPTFLQMSCYALNV